MKNIQNLVAILATTLVLGTSCAPVKKFIWKRQMEVSKESGNIQKYVNTKLKYESWYGPLDKNIKISDRYQTDSIPK